jgi:hypothetical protein
MGVFVRRLFVPPFMVPMYDPELARSGLHDLFTLTVTKGVHDG